jgi:protein-S-isoprenylcysteine O-methyltransferase Ste14
MALREEFESSGNWLFRWRSYLPLILITITLLALRDYRHIGSNILHNYIWDGFCLFVGLFGQWIRILTIGHTCKDTSGRNTALQVAGIVNTTGLYSTVRHPLYLGNFFMALGLALFTQQWWFVVIYTLSFWVYYERIMFAEESFLRNKFGDAYLEWANKTPAFIPNFKSYVKPDLPFSFRNVLKREYNGFFALIFLFYTFDIIRTYFADKKFVFDPIWTGMVIFSFMAWLTLRTLKKKTRLLHVDGR